MLAYPLSIQDGKLLLTFEAEDIVRMAIVSALATVKQERVWRPKYGRTWQPFDRASLPSIVADCQQAIADGLTNCPRTVFEVFASVDDSGRVAIDVFYSPGGQVSVTLG